MLLAAYLAVVLAANARGLADNANSILRFVSIRTNHVLLFTARNDPRRSVYVDSYRSALILAGVLSHIVINPETARFVTRINRLGYIEKTLLKNPLLQMIAEEGTFTQIAYVRLVACLKHSS